MTVQTKTSVRQNRTGGDLPSVDFIKSDFEALIEQKGYDCLIEKAMYCACRGHEGGHQALSSCRNCGGTGWIYINRIETKILLTSMNQQSKYNEWSREKLGMVKITVKDADKIGENDRITVLAGESYYTESFKTKYNGSIEFSLLSYPCLEVDVVHMFVNVSTKHLQIIEGDDFTITDNIFKLTDKWAKSAYFNDEGDSVGHSISIRYKHQPVYHVMDIPRDTMVTDIFDDDTDNSKPFQMPVHAIGRRAHYIQGIKGLNDEGLFDNSTIEYQ